MELTLLWLVPALVAAAATAVGRYEEQRGLTWLNVPLRALWSLMVVAVLVTAFVVREDGVTWGQFLFGIAVGVIGLALLPVFVFYVLGRLVHRTWLLIVLWVLRDVRPRHLHLARRAALPARRRLRARLPLLTGWRSGGGVR